MKAVILSDGLGFAARARSILQRVGRRPDVDVHWTVKSWPIAALNRAVSSRSIQSETEDAHLVIISGDQARTLPRPLRNWLAQWARRRSIAQAAVGVIDESGPLAFEGFFDLRRLIDEHGLSLITGQTHRTAQRTEASSTCSEEPGQRLSPGRTQYRKQTMNFARRERY